MKHNPPRPHWIREHRLPTLDEIAWLQSPAGRDACRAMAETEPADTPAAIERWRQRLTPAQVSAAWAQVLLRRTARAKFSRADDMLFDRVGLEQATDETIAAHKARRFQGLGRVADLCCGIGGDALALAAGRELVAVDLSPARAAMAAHNARVYGHEIAVRTGDVSFEKPPADAAHIDPDRRPAGRRTHGIESGSPGLPALQNIVAHYRHVAIKLSPGADFDELPFPAEIELISHHGECRQAVAWTGDFARAHRRATVLPTGQSLAALPGEPLDWPAPHPPEPGGFLYEPDPAIIRADLVGVLARQYNLAPIDPHIAWLTGDCPLPPANPPPNQHPEEMGTVPFAANQHPGEMETVPFAAPSRPSALFRVFRILDVRPWSAKPARAWLARHDIGPLEIKTRGFAASPETILKHLRPAGPRPAVLFLTRIENRPTAILAERLATTNTS